MRASDSGPALAILPEIGAILLDAGSNAMNTHPIVATVLHVTAILAGSWIYFSKIDRWPAFEQARVTTMLVVVILGALSCMIWMQNQPLPFIEGKFQVHPHNIADGAMIDGVRWSKSFRPYTFEVSNRWNTTEALDLLVEVRMPGIVKHATIESTARTHDLSVSQGNQGAGKVTMQEGDTITGTGSGDSNLLCVRMGTLEPGGQVRIKLVVDYPFPDHISDGYVAGRHRYTYFGQVTPLPPYFFRLGVTDTETKAFGLTPSPPQALPFTVSGSFNGVGSGRQMLLGMGCVGPFCSCGQ